MLLKDHWVLTHASCCYCCCWHSEHSPLRFPPSLHHPLIPIQRKGILQVLAQTFDSCVLCVYVLALSCLTLYDPMDQAPQSMGFFRQEYWSGLPFPPPGDLPNPGIEPASPALTGRFFTTEPPGKHPMWFGFGQMNLVQRNLSTALLHPSGHLC